MSVGKKNGKVKILFHEQKPVKKLSAVNAMGDVHNRKWFWPKETFCLQTVTNQPRRILAPCQRPRPSIFERMSAFLDLQLQCSSWLFQSKCFCSRRQCQEPKVQYQFKWEQRTSRLLSFRLCNKYYRLEACSLRKTISLSQQETTTKDFFKMPQNHNEYTEMFKKKKKAKKRGAACVLTHDHQGELEAPLDRLPVHLVGEACKADISLQILLLL